MIGDAAMLDASVWLRAALSLAGRFPLLAGGGARVHAQILGWAFAFTVSLRFVLGKPQHFEGNLIRSLIALQMWYVAQPGLAENGR